MLLARLISGEGHKRSKVVSCEGKINQTVKNTMVNMMEKIVDYKDRKPRVKAPRVLAAL